MVPVVVGALVLVAAGLTGWRLLPEPTAYQQAVTWLPASTLRASYTDWAQVRDRAGGTSLGAASSAREVDRFLDRAYDLDLTTASAVSVSTYVLMHKYGFSPLDADWEIFGQSREGAVDVLRLDETVDMAGIERTLRTLGYTAPAAGSDRAGVWTGSADLVATLDPALSSTQQNVAVLVDQRVVLMGDDATYLSAAAAVVRGSSDGLASVSGVENLARVVPDVPVSALLWAGDFACEDLSMGAADEEDQRVAEDLVADAGGVSPLAGLVIARVTSGSLTVGLHFESDDQAESNLQQRVDLASGPAPGQGGSFADRFSVTSAQVDGSDVVLRLRPRAAARPGVFSDITQGPILFATC